jgi:hypothetical protein
MCTDVKMIWKTWRARRERELRTRRGLQQSPCGMICKMALGAAEIAELLQFAGDVHICRPNL